MPVAARDLQQFLTRLCAGIHKICCPLSATSGLTAPQWEGCTECVLPLEEVSSAAPAELVTPGWRNEGQLGRSLLRRIIFYFKIKSAKDKTLFLAALLSSDSEGQLESYLTDVQCHPRPHSSAGTCRRLQISIKGENKSQQVQFTNKNVCMTWKRIISLLCFDYHLFEFKRHLWMCSNLKISSILLESVWVQTLTHFYSHDRLTSLFYISLNFPTFSERSMVWKQNDSWNFIHIKNQNDPCDEKQQH